MSWIDTNGRCSNCYAILDSSQIMDTNLKISGTKMMTIEIGAIVRLKSGGPRMTAGKIGAEGRPESVQCMWFPTDFNGMFGHPDNAWFNIHTLDIINDDDDNEGELENDDISEIVQSMDVAADEGRSFYIDVGDLTPEEANLYISNIKGNFRK
jgi:uncharacterized protein YodC (DUF2158 family)